LSRTEEKWNAVLQTPESHSHAVLAPVFSLDGKTLASASEDHTVTL
jgi:WD40 repeat protein